MPFVLTLPPTLLHSPLPSLASRVEISTEGGSFYMEIDNFPLQGDKIETFCSDG